MKCLHIITDLEIGGAETALFNILNNGLGSMHDNHIISLMRNGPLAQSIIDIGVPVITLGMQQGKPSVHAIKELNKIIKKLQPQIVQGWMYHGNLAASLAAFLAPNTPKIVWNIRQTLYELKDEKRLTRWIIRTSKLLSKHPAAILYNSHLSRTQHEEFGYSAKKSRIIPNGIDLHKFHPNSNIGEIVRNELGIPHNALVIGHVARFHAMKDHVNFLQAASQLVKQHKNVYFLMLGNQVNRENEKLSALITNTLSHKLHMLGEGQKVERMMASMDLFCTSSAWGEAFPNVIGEAMATAIPCIATDVGDSARIIENTGIVVPPKNNLELLNAMQNMTAMPENERLALGKAARQRIIENYSIESIVTKYNKLYSGLAD